MPENKLSSQIETKKNENNNDNSYDRYNIQILNNTNKDSYKTFRNNIYESHLINNDYYMPQNNFFNSNFKIKGKWNIISLLKNNPNIISYIYIIDYLTFEEISNMLSFLSQNLEFFSSNAQNYILIDKIISLYIPNLSIKNKGKNDNLNENIYSFLKSFFNKRISSLIYSNNNISCILNLVLKIRYPKNDFVYIEIENEFKSFAYNRQGCLLIQNLYRLGNEIQQQKLLNIILEQYNELILDKYGHYLFKYLLYQAENGEKYYNIIFNKIINDVKKYINNKYSSVVIERLLDSSDINIKNKIIEKICRNENDVVELLYHAYGNYVLQKIINVTKDNNILELIYKTIMKNKNALLKLSYGKKIMKEISAIYTLK